MLAEIRIVDNVAIQLVARERSCAVLAAMATMHTVDPVLDRCLV
jgi:hypothetical protein